jgi:hypothetical protein
MVMKKKLREKQKINFMIFHKAEQQQIKKCIIKFVLINSAQKVRICCIYLFLQKTSH